MRPQGQHIHREESSKLDNDFLSFIKKHVLVLCLAFLGIEKCSYII
jgi:hypothetical protein